MSILFSELNCSPYAKNTLNAHALLSLKKNTPETQTIVCFVTFLCN